jgi:hypothetical protein
MFGVVGPHSHASRGWSAKGSKRAEMAQTLNTDPPSRVSPLTHPIFHTSHNLSPSVHMATTFESPSKRAASSLKDMSLDSPKKTTAPTSTFNPLDKSIAEHSNDDEDDAVVAKPAASHQDSIEDYRTRFVGEVDLDEKDEPLLKESSRRFVLFPIQYHEVRTRFTLGRRVFFCRVSLSQHDCRALPK